MTLRRQLLLVCLLTLVLPGGRGSVDALGAGAALVASVSWSVGVFRARVRPGLVEEHFL